MGIECFPIRLSQKDKDLIKKCSKEKNLSVTNFALYCVMKEITIYEVCKYEIKNDHLYTKDKSTRITLKLKEYQKQKLIDISNKRNIDTSKYILYCIKKIIN